MSHLNKLELQNFRITSYNVCYTKLLRQGFEHGSDRGRRRTARKSLMLSRVRHCPLSQAESEWLRADS